MKTYIAKPGKKSNPLSLENGGFEVRVVFEKRQRIYPNIKAPTQYIRALLKKCGTALEIYVDEELEWNRIDGYLKDKNGADKKSSNGINRISI